MVQSSPYRYSFAFECADDPWRINRLHKLNLGVRPELLHRERETVETQLLFLRHDADIAIRCVWVDTLQAQSLIHSEQAFYKRAQLQNVNTNNVSFPCWWSSRKEAALY